MLGAFLPGSSLTILPVCGAELPVSAAWAGRIHAPVPASKAIIETRKSILRTAINPR